MKPTDYMKLEGDFAFKRSYLNRTAWWMNGLLIAPTLFLFLGLAGVMYLLNNDMLLSWYVIPYLVFFVIGTVWLKAVRRHIRKSRMAVEGAFRVCLAKAVGEKDGYVYTVFTNGNKRHNEHLIKQLGDSLNVDEMPEQRMARKRSVAMRDEASDTDFYLRAFQKGDLRKYNPKAGEGRVFPVLFIDTKYTFVVRGQDL